MEIWKENNKSTHPQNAKLDILNSQKMKNAFIKLNIFIIYLETIFKESEIKLYFRTQSFLDIRENKLNFRIAMNTYNILKNLIFSYILFQFI